MITATNERAAALIHSNVSVNEKGHLCFAGMDTVELAKKHGTALYLIDENRIRSNARTYIDQHSLGIRIRIVDKGQAAHHQQIVGFRDLTHGALPQGKTQYRGGQQEIAQHTGF